MGSIRIDYERCRREAHRLRRQSNELAQVIDSLYGIMNQTAHVWQGPAATVFLENNEKLAKDMEKLRWEMQETAGFIEYALTAFEAAERQINGML